MEANFRNFCKTVSCGNKFAVIASVVVLLCLYVRTVAQSVIAKNTRLKSWKPIAKFVGCCELIRGMVGRLHSEYLVVIKYR